MGSLYSLYIYLIFLYHVNQCRVQLGTNKVVVVAAIIHYYSTETDTTHVDDFLFFVFPPIIENGAAVHLSFICLFV